MLRSKLACETGLKEGVHILRALHNDGLLVVIGKDEEALLLHRLDDDSRRSGRVSSARYGNTAELAASARALSGVMPMARSVSQRLVSTLPGQRTETPMPLGRA